ncbi:UDP-glycosyltransferase 76B1-like [Chenopodium quinoa]|uniref:Glycosyltransferase n=1 Tax=Chenopodium quinoa TaxID=63459 RepID=A0A803M3K8_CHEQI|nr:UDP-glycosyltransferase 76B1-like [Chenopodium quinoa]
MRRRLVLFPLPLQGHQTPMLLLASILYSKGFSISIIHTQFNSPNPDNYPHFTFHPISESLLGCKASNADVIGLLNTLNVYCVVPFRDLLAQILSQNAVKEPVACLITDAMWHFTQDVADNLMLPRIVLRTSNPSSFVAFSSLSYFRENGYLSAQGCQLEEKVPELPPLKMKDIPILGTRDLEATYGLVCNMIEKTKSSRGLIFNSFEELEGPALAMLQQDFNIPIFAIGPFHKQAPSLSSGLLTQERDCISWLNAHAPKSVLYISFGSIAAVSEADFLEIAWGLANSKQPFLWAIRPGLVRGLDGPAPLPTGFLEKIAKQGRIVTWAPQDEVLAHPAVGGFMTHSGWNSTLESICEGVPMLCFPCFGDQMVNARHVTDVWKVGLRFENGLNRDDIENSIRRVLVENEGKEMSQSLACLKEKASLCLAAGGSSHKSLETLVSHILSF